MLGVVFGLDWYTCSKVEKDPVLSSSGTMSWVWTEGRELAAIKNTNGADQPFPRRLSGPLVKKQLRSTKDNVGMTTQAGEATSASPLRVPPCRELLVL